jgi:splicing factor 3B subunit 3
MFDIDTIAVADKFGSLVILRLPSGAEDDATLDPTGDKGLYDRGLLNGASNKVDNLCTFYLGDTTTSLQKAVLMPGGQESLVYTTLSGTIGILVPFNSREDHEFFQHLEMHMRLELPSLVGREHTAFRSYYHPVKNVIDGDLCEKFSALPIDRQRSIANELDRTPNDVSKRLEDIRTRFAF